MFIRKVLVWSRKFLTCTTTEVKEKISQVNIPSRNLLFSK